MSLCYDSGEAQIVRKKWVVNYIEERYNVETIWRVINILPHLAELQIS